MPASSAFDCALSDCTFSDCTISNCTHSDGTLSADSHTAQDPIKNTNAFTAADSYSLNNEPLSPALQKLLKPAYFHHQRNQRHCQISLDSANAGIATSLQLTVHYHNLLHYDAQGRNQALNHYQALLTQALAPLCGEHSLWPTLVQQLLNQAFLLDQDALREQQAQQDIYQQQLTTFTSQRQLADSAISSQEVFIPLEDFDLNIRQQQGDGRCFDLALSLGSRCHPSGCLQQQDFSLWADNYHSPGQSRIHSSHQLQTLINSDDSCLSAVLNKDYRWQQPPCQNSSQKNHCSQFHYQRELDLKPLLMVDSRYRSQQLLKQSLIPGGDKISAMAMAQTPSTQTPSTKAPTSKAPQSPQTENDSNKKATPSDKLITWVA